MCLLSSWTPSTRIGFVLAAAFEPWACWTLWRHTFLFMSKFSSSSPSSRATMHSRAAHCSASTAGASPPPPPQAQEHQQVEQVPPGSHGAHACGAQPFAPTQHTMFFFRQDEQGQPQVGEVQQGGLLPGQQQVVNPPLPQTPAPPSPLAQQLLQQPPSTAVAEQQQVANSQAPRSLLLLPGIQQAQQPFPQQPLEPRPPKTPLPSSAPLQRPPAPAPVAPRPKPTPPHRLSYQWVLTSQHSS